MTNAEQDEQATPSADRLSRRSGWSNWTVLALLVLCFFLVVRFQPLHWAGCQDAPEPGKTLSQLRLQPLTGGTQPVTLADLSGQVVLVYFWGTWCPPCRTELARIADIERKFHDQPAFKLLAVSCGRGVKEDPAVLDYDTRVFLQQANITMPTYCDPENLSRQAVDEAVGFEYPTTLVLDRQGTIRGVWSGQADPGEDGEMRQLIARLLHGP
jgi:cytochrome c biogenesis protein CcmG, thiol:disulfide interchange protein DsbE